jgi:ribonuclease HI
MGLGIMVWDSSGNLLAARCDIRLGCLALAAAEAKAAMLAIQLCHEMGFLGVHLEGDAKFVVNAINSVDVDKSWLGHVIEDIKVELKSLAHWKMTFVKREGNQVAHNLAKYVVMIFFFFFYMSTQG